MLYSKLVSELEKDILVMAERISSSTKAPLNWDASVPLPSHHFPPCPQIDMMRNSALFQSLVQDENTDADETVFRNKTGLIIDCFISNPIVAKPTDSGVVHHSVFHATEWNSEESHDLLDMDI